MKMMTFDYSIGFRNGVGIDLAGLPKQSGISKDMEEGAYNLLEINMLQVLLPFIFIQFGTIVSEPLDRADAEALVNEDIRRFTDDD
jgi:hypothetical protein